MCRIPVMTIGSFKIPATNHTQIPLLCPRWAGDTLLPSWWKILLYDGGVWAGWRWWTGSSVPVYWRGAEDGNDADALTTHFSSSCDARAQIVLILSLSLLEETERADETTQKKTTTSLTTGEQLCVTMTLSQHWGGRSCEWKDAHWTDAVSWTGGWVHKEERCEEIVRINV